MADWLYVVINVVVAAFVGGITNHFAIKMLFHPRNPVHIGKFKVPFTPGLIPKRRDDIAESLGRVVAEYLVTAEGLQETVQRPAFRQKAEGYLQGLIERWEASTLTLGDAAVRIWGEAGWEALKPRLAAEARRASAAGFESLWRRYEWDSIPLKSSFPAGRRQAARNGAPPRRKRFCRRWKKSCCRPQGSGCCPRWLRA